MLFRSNYDLARNVSQEEDELGVLWKAHLQFCRVVGKYAKPEANLRKACESWNREWDQLFGFAVTPGTPPDSLRERIEKVESRRLRFCDALTEKVDSLLNRSRIEDCKTSAKLATATDRAILLGEF